MILNVCAYPPFLGLTSLSGLAFAALIMVSVFCYFLVFFGKTMTWRDCALNNIWILTGDSSPSKQVEGLGLDTVRQ